MLDIGTGNYATPADLSITFGTNFSPTLAHILGRVLEGCVAVSRAMAQSVVEWKEKKNLPRSCMTP